MTIQAMRSSSMKFMKNKGKKEYEKYLFVRHLHNMNEGFDE